VLEALDALPTDDPDGWVVAAVGLLAAGEHRLVVRALVELAPGAASLPTARVRSSPGSPT